MIWDMFLLHCIYYMVIYVIGRYATLMQALINQTERERERLEDPHPVY